MQFSGFEAADFEVFEVPGLEARMESLKGHLRPRLEQLGHDMSEYLSELVGVPMFPHVAKHARRTVNPPNDSWVAFCPDKRGYKKHPHFQIGAWSTHAFATFGLIYESPQRGAYAQQLKLNAAQVISTIPTDYYWVPNHMDPHALPASEVDESQLMELAERLVKGRQGELLVGIKIPKEEAVSMTAEAFESKVKDCFTHLLPLYRLANLEEVYA